VAVKVLSDSGSGYYSDIAEGIVDAPFFSGRTRGALGPRS
jgi:hypothetical protein